MTPRPPRRRPLLARTLLLALALASVLWLIGLLGVGVAESAASDDLLAAALLSLSIPAAMICALRVRPVARGARQAATNAPRPRRGARIVTPVPCCHCGRNPRQPRRPARIAHRPAQRPIGLVPATRYRRPARIITRH